MHLTAAAVRSVGPCVFAVVLAGCAAAPAAAPASSASSPAPTSASSASSPAPSGARASASAGAHALGSTPIDVPDGAVHVALTGSDSAGDGTADRPFATVARAVSAAPDGGTVVLSSGSYTESVDLPEGKRLTVEAAPAAVVWFDGSSVLGPAVPSGGLWKVSGYDQVFDHSPTYDRGAPDNDRPGWRFVPADRPMAAHPDQVWVGGKPLEQVARRSAVRPGTFWVDTAGSALWLGRDPKGQEVRASVLQTALRVTAPGTRLIGFGVRRYATSVPQMGTVRVDAPGVRIADVVIKDNATQGLFVGASDIVLDHVTSSGNGMLGVQANYADDLTITGLKATDNNTQGFNLAPVSGGVKITRSRGISVTGSVVSANAGHGLWFDESCFDVVVVGDDLDNNDGEGLRLELSQQVVVADNRIRSSAQAALHVANTGAVRVWNNTFADGARLVEITQDSRSQFDTGAAGHDPRQPAPDPTVPWSSTDIALRNNLLLGSSGDSLLAVEDFTHRRSAAQMKVSADHDVYIWATGDPVWVVVWSSGSGDPRTYTTIAAFHREGQELHGLERRVQPSAVGALPQVPRSVPVAVPAEIAGLLGHPATAPHVGAWESVAGSG